MSFKANKRGLQHDYGHLLEYILKPDAMLMLSNQNILSNQNSIKY